MRGLRRFFYGLTSLFQKRLEEQELGAELRSYIEESVQRRLGGGMSDAEARRAACVERGAWSRSRTA
jgi:hypothetical protein